MEKRQLSKTEFKPRAFEILRRVEEERAPYVVTDRGKAVVEIRPVGVQRREALERLRGQVKSYERPLDPVDEDWEATS